MPELCSPNVLFCCRLLSVASFDNQYHVLCLAPLKRSGKSWLIPWTPSRDWIATACVSGVLLLNLRRSLLQVSTILH